MRPGFRIARSVRSVLPPGRLATGKLPVARDRRVCPTHPVASLRRRFGARRTTTTAQAIAAATATVVRLRRLPAGAPGSGHVVVRSHVLPEVLRFVRYSQQQQQQQQVADLPRMRSAHAVSSARQRVGQVAGRETVAGPVARVRATGRGQNAVPAGQAPFGPAQVRPGVPHHR